MHGAFGYLLAAAVVFGVNLMPAFGPPTWSLLVLMKLNWELNTAALVVIGAVSAGLGRLLLAKAAHALRGHLSERRRANLTAAQERLEQHRSGTALGLGLFALSPLPSAQLFEAAGVLGLRLLPLTLAFFAGRLVSYSIYLSAATVAQHSYGQLIKSALTSPTGIALQVGMLVVIVLISEIDWTKAARRKKQPRRD